MAGSSAGQLRGRRHLGRRAGVKSLAVKRTLVLGEGLCGTGPCLVALPATRSPDGQGGFLTGPVLEFGVLCPGYVEMRAAFVPPQPSRDLQGKHKFLCHIAGTTPGTPCWIDCEL